MRYDDSNWSLEKRLYTDRYPENGHDMDVNRLADLLYKELVLFTKHKAISRQEELNFLTRFDLNAYLTTLTEEGKKFNIHAIMDKQARDDRKLYRAYKAWVTLRMTYGY